MRKDRVEIEEKKVWLLYRKGVVESVHDNKVSIDMAARPTDLLIERTVYNLRKEPDATRYSQRPN